MSEIAVEKLNLRTLKLMRNQTLVRTVSVLFAATQRKRINDITTLGAIIANRTIVERRKNETNATSAVLWRNIGRHAMCLNGN